MLKTNKIKRIKSSLKMTFLISCCILILLNICGCVSTARFEVMRKRVEEAEKQRDKVTEERDKVTEERDKVTEEFRITKLALNNVRKELSAALNKLKQVEEARDQAIARLKTAEFNLEEAEAVLQIANENLATAVTERNTARRLAKIAEDAKMRAETTKKRVETERDTARRLTKIAEDAKDRAETAKKKAETERDTARRLTKIAEDAKDRAETERDTARRLTKIAEDRVEAAEEKVSLVPEATIHDVRIDEKKSDIDIYVKFNIKNRKGIKCSIYGYLYLENGQRLLDKNGNPISLRKEFTPKKVTEENLNAKLSIKHVKLNLGQPDDIVFIFRIYDKPTNSFLDRHPYKKPFYYKN